MIKRTRKENCVARMALAVQRQRFAHKSRRYLLKFGINDIINTIYDTLMDENKDNEYASSLTSALLSNEKNIDEGMEECNDSVCRIDEWHIDVSI